MANRRKVGYVSTSYDDDGKVRIRRFMVVRSNGTCLVSYTALFSGTDRLAVGSRKEWDVVCILDGEVLPMVDDAYSSTGWRIGRELTPDEVERLEFEYHLPLLEDEAS